MTETVGNWLSGEDIGLPFFNGQEYSGICINHGDFANIYDIALGFVAKVLKDTREYKGERSRLWDELRDHQAVYAGGVSCPRPYGIYDIPILVPGWDRDHVIVHPGIVMDKIDAVDTSLLTFDERAWAMNQFRRELRKLEKLGFESDEHAGWLGHFKNALLGSNKRLYLIDFEFLKRREQEAR